MRRSEFDRAVEEEFGSAHGRVLLRDLVLDALGGRTPAEAMAEGARPGAVWAALCAAMDVPPERWHGRGLASPENARHAAG